MSKNYFIILFLIVSSSYAQNSEGKTSQIDDKNLSDLVSLYPNPVNDVVHIRTGNFKIIKVEIFSLLGGKVKEVKSNFKSIFIGDLLRGIYMVKIYSEDTYIVKKLIKN